MEIEVSAEAKGKRLNQLVAITVVCLSVFMGLANIRDDNIVQAMQQAKSDALDTWNQYQATKLKQHLAETAGYSAIASAQPILKAEVAKYSAEAGPLEQKAKGFEARYDALNVHDDQFDACDALVSIAVSVAAVAALVEAPWVLFVAWAFGALGVFMGMAGFLGWAFHPAVLNILGG